MKNYNPLKPIITGVGVTSAIGQGKKAFSAALFEGHQNFQVMQRPGRQKDTAFIGAEIPTLVFPERLSKRVLRSASFTGQVALATLYEAWEEANLAEVDPERIGLIVGGSNLQQRELVQIYDKYQGRNQFLPPTYGFSFLDSDLCGLCTEFLGIKGLACTVGGASASGQVAILQAIQALQTGKVDVCIAMGALMDLSYWECQALRSLGAMGTDRYQEEPESACRPFDQNRDGFIYGEACGALVLERDDTARSRRNKPYAIITGGSIVIDGNRNPNPSYEGEVRAIKGALAEADWSAPEIDYVNPHGTGSLIGDETELQAIRDCQLDHAAINTTKAITGHGLTAAGAVEVIATILQMRAACLHPSPNLEDPLDASYNWVRSKSESHVIDKAISLSMGFGGVNTALCLQKY